MEPDKLGHAPAQVLPERLWPGRLRPWARLLVVALAATVAGAVVGLESARAHDAPPKSAEPSAPRSAPTLADYDAHQLKLGGDFTLSDQNGRLTRLKDFRSRTLLLFFGYTFCPDVCPMTTAKMGLLKRKLERQGVKLQPIFVSIDPERDTPARMKTYLAGFERGIVGLTGSPAAIRHAADVFHVTATKQEGMSPEQYLMSHTQYLFLLDGQGRLRYLFPVDASDELLIEGVRQLARN